MSALAASHATQASVAANSVPQAPLLPAPEPPVLSSALQHGSPSSPDQGLDAGNAPLALPTIAGGEPSEVQPLPTPSPQIPASQQGPLADAF